MDQQFPGARVLVVRDCEEITLWRPRDPILHIQGEISEYGYSQVFILQKDSSYGTAVILKDFSGKIGLPSGVAFDIRGWEDGSAVYGVVSGPGNIKVNDSDVEVAYPTRLRCVAFGDSLYVKGDRVDHPEDDDEKASIETEAGLESLVRKGPTYPVRTPEAVDSEGNIHLVRSLGNVPWWLSDDIITANMHRVLIVDGRRVSIGNYSDGFLSGESGYGQPSLFNYVAGCLRGEATPIEIE